MEKLSAEEVVRRDIFVGPGRTSMLRDSALFQETKKLKVGEAVVTTVKEWPLKNIPTGATLNSAHRKTGMKFSVRRLPLAKGYAFVRIK